MCCACDGGGAESLERNRRNSRSTVSASSATANGDPADGRRSSSCAGGRRRERWRIRLSGNQFLTIFISGALFSLFMFAVLNFVPSPDSLAGRVGFGSDRSLSSQRPRYLPDEKVLKVVDEARVVEPYLPAMKIHPLPEGSNVAKDAAPDGGANDQEALSSLKMAQEMRQQGKDDKALRLFQHALALSPKHPEILTKYGEFLEHSQLDVVSADQYYTQALTVNPYYSEALANRQRTAQIVEHLDKKRFERLDQKRDALTAVHASNVALKRAEKEAYIQHIYHSVGIEGNTMSLAQTRSVLETKMAVDGKSIDEHNEILGLDAALKYINATLVNKNDFITLKDILEIHRRVLGHVDPIEGGEFRRSQVYVGGHIPPGPGDLAILMSRFENWLNSSNGDISQAVPGTF